ncbi:FtsK/SpoIIIE family DNA translocase [Roseibium aestuarii]|uniref:DNA translocase FtsK n=1 Tax=Roseibium aestuarii TaxID=2600299 RepID=A0ABW4JZ94_9HYPH|nr:DNA translocase FtsK [Roseibium aestuarii]
MRRASVANDGNRRTTVDLLDTQSPLKRFLKRNLVGLCGLSVIALAAALAASLATWSVEDPSFNHATDEAARNALGWPGAAIADVLMQSVGLATSVFLVPVVFWGWRLLSGHSLNLRRKRLGYWIAGTLLASGALAALPVPESWPLPTGLGGFMGDGIHTVPALLTGNLTEGAATILGALGLGLPAIFCLVVATGVFGRADRSDEVELASAKAGTRMRPSGHGYTLDDDLGDDDEESESRLALLASAGLGLAAHWSLMGLSTLRRVTGLGGRKSRDDEWDEDDDAYELEDERHASALQSFRKTLARKLMPEDDDGLSDFVDQGRRPSPASVPATRTRARPAAAPIAAPHEDEVPFGDDEPPFETDAYADADADEWDEDGQEFAPDELMSSKGRVPNQPRQPIGIAAPSAGPAAHLGQPQNGRVIPQAPRPKEGKRVQEESQPSLLGAPEDYELPPLRLLEEPKVAGKTPGLSADALEQNARILEGVLEDFGVRGEIIEVRPGPVVTLYELEPAPGIKSSRVIGLADDIARSMSAISARVAVIPGKNAIGIELPNARRETVYLRELLAAQDFEKSKAKLALALGKTINGESVVADLARMPHLLVAGTTGSGKSVSINTMILSLLYRLTPDECKMIMIDPKMLELSIYDGIPHLLTPVVTDPKKAVVALKWTVREMEERYKKMSKMGVRNIDGYNTRIKQAIEKGESFSRTVQTGFDRETGQPVYEEEEMPLEKMPFIVVIVDEMADLMMVAGKDIEGAIQRLAQMARAAGIHIIMATQRPSVDVITGTIKANFPTRISFQVTSKIDSRTILGEMGAEQLLGMGDMLYMAGGGRTQRVHGPFVSDGEVEDIVSHLKVQGTPQYLEAVTEEDEGGDSPYDEGGMGGGDGDDGNDLYYRAVAIVLRDKKASTSYVQRRLSIGYNRAASLIERMEREGLISSANHAGKREILVQNGNDDDL